MGENVNVLVIVIDALRAKNLSCYGYPKLTSPNIDRLAKEGVLFENAYSCSDHTDPSFTTIFSGKYPISHGIIHHEESVTEEELRDFRLTGTKLLAEILAEAGYCTMGIDWLGRWHKRGYSFYGEYTEKNKKIGYRNLLIESIGKTLYKLPYPIQKVLRKIRKTLDIPVRHNARDYTNLAIDLIKNVQDKFFMLIHYWDVHTPFDSIPKEFVDKFYENEKSEKVEDMLKSIECSKWRDLVERYHLKDVKFVHEVECIYNSAINYVDYNIGRLVDFLKDEGTYENTLIIVTGDHGDNLMRNGIFMGHFGLYESVIHVPLIFSGGALPRGVLKGQRIEGFVQHVDIVPTILDILGVCPKSHDFDGESLLPLMLGEKLDLRGQIFAMEAGRERFAIRIGDYKYIYSPSPEKLYLDKWKENDILFKPACRSVRELYNLKEDPEESRNIVDEEKDIANDLEEKLLSQIKMLKTKKEKTIIKNNIRKLSII